jgi:anhydro-N-acetylmuramic acid kinase
MAVAHPLTRLLARRRLRVLGVNSGTSIDGLDLALAEIHDGSPFPSVHCVRVEHFSYPRRLREALANLAASETISKEGVARTHFVLGEFIADTVVRQGLRREATRAPLRGGTRVDLIGSHGQTIGHFPARRRGAAGSATWQIGALNAIAQRTGVVTIGDFRAGDIAAGGMGAPLSGYYHHILFGMGIPVLNLGGIANISISRYRRGRVEILAFDAGPGNMMIDALARILLDRPYDADGRVARSGRPLDDIVAAALKEPYFHRRPPKTCGREEFGLPAVKRLFFKRGVPRAAAADLLASAVEITVRAVACAITRWVAPVAESRTLVVTGGGTRNLTLTKRLESRLPQWRLCGAEDWGIPSRFVEPVGFAVLAHETLRARAGNVGGGTGAREPAVLGLVALPSPERL